MRKKIITLLLVCCALLSACSASPKQMPQTQGAPRPEASGSALYTLSFDRASCTVSVLDKAGNVVLSTNPIDPEEDEFTAPATLNNLRSQLIVSYYNDLNVDTTVGSYLSSVKRETFTVTEKSANHIRVDYDFSRKDEQFIIPVEYRLENDCFRVRILTDEINEYGNKKISRISLMPYLLRGSCEEEGYLLLPDGSGATVEFSSIRPNAATYSAQIYGQNPADALYYLEGSAKTAMLPVFGADYGDHSILARVDSNAAAGWINARAAGSQSSYANAYACFDYRVFDTVSITGSDWQHKDYVAVSELVEKEDFSVSYYLISEGGLNALANKARETAEEKWQTPTEVLTAVLYAYGATTQRTAFLGIPYTETLTATDFSDLSAMLDALSGENTRIAVLLQDFDKDSLNEDYPDGIRWSSASGGKSAFSDLRATHENTAFYCVQNMLYENCTSLIWANQHRFARMVSRENLARYTYSPVTYAHEKSDDYALELSYLMEQTENALEEAADSGCGVALRYFGTELYGDYRDSEGTTRQTYLRALELLLSTYAAQSLAVDGGNEYTLGNADLNYNIPVSSSAYALETASVPFLQMVYHGGATLVSTALNMTDDPERELLRCIASGTIPCYSVTQIPNEELRRSGYKDLFGTGFDLQKERISEVLEATEAYYQAIFNQKIVSYVCENGVSVTTYENGVRAVVNETESPVRYEDRQIEALDFLILF